MSVGKKLKNMFGGGGEEEDLTLEREETDDDDSKGFLTDSMQSVSMCPPMNNNCFFCFVGIVQLRERVKVVHAHLLASFEISWCVTVSVGFWHFSN